MAGGFLWLMLLGVEAEDISIGLPNGRLWNDIVGFLANSALIGGQFTA